MGQVPVGGKGRDSYMTATDELRRMLDDAGVEHEDPSPDHTNWGLNTSGWYDYNANEDVRGILNLRMFGITPEQAIEATLWRGTCYDVGNLPNAFECSNCGVLFDVADPDGEPTMWTSDNHPTVPRFCPNCGSRIEVDDA